MRNKKICRQLVLLALFLPLLLGAGPLSELTWEGPVFTEDREEYRPKEELVREGKTYRLVSSRLRRAVKEGEPTYASANVPFSLEGKEQPPETAMITIEDETTKLTFEREVPRLEVMEKETVWSEDFTFPVTVAGYDADSYLLGETEIPADGKLSDYGEELLTWLGLPLDSYRVETVKWKGPPYEQNGVLFRDAVAEGAKLLRNVEVKYGGQVMTPTIRGRQYIGFYEEVPSAEETEEAIQETEKAILQPAQSQGEVSVRQEPDPSFGLAEALLYWLATHRTIVRLGLGFFAVLSAVLWLFIWTGRGKKKSRD